MSGLVPIAKPESEGWVAQDRYRGTRWIEARLPTETEPWPTGSKRAGGRAYDIGRGDVREYASGKPWVWPSRRIHFLTDQHADADAFLASLVASGDVEKIGPHDGDLVLLERGRDARFIIGGDCFDKGPSNLRLLSVLKAFLDVGADVEILAGNHDVRTVVGLSCMEARDPLHAHLFVRMGKKCTTLLKEVWDGWVDKDAESAAPHADEVRRRLWPSAAWYDEFPQAVDGLVPANKVQREIGRIREKTRELEETALELGLTLPRLYLAAMKARELFLTPEGAFSWYFQRMVLATRAGSFLFIHAGVDDALASILRAEGTEGLNARFRHLFGSNLFELYHGSIGSAFRTKYRPMDRPFTRRGVQDMHAAGLYAIVHGHQSIPYGQRFVMRNGLLNVECDCSVDSGTRSIQGLQGAGAAVTTLDPSGVMLGVSTDHPTIKAFRAADLLTFVTLVGESP
jgi:hypothetical protein